MTAVAAAAITGSRRRTGGGAGGETIGALAAGGTTPCGRACWEGAGREGAGTGAGLWSAGGAATGATAAACALGRGTCNSFAISRSCSSVKSMLSPHRQQSAVISQMRTDIGALQSGQPQRIVSPSSQNRPLPWLAEPSAPFDGGAAGARGKSLSVGSAEFDRISKVGIAATGWVGSGAASAACSGRKSKPISPAPKLCCSSES